MARIVQEHYRDIQGRERGLLVASRAFLVAGVAGCLACVVVAILTGAFLWLAAGVVCAVSGIVLFLAFGALSEIIVMLKRVLGLPVVGVISGTKAGTVSVCSECGGVTWPDSEKCASCGADFAPGSAPGEGPDPH